MVNFPCFAFFPAAAIVKAGFAHLEVKKVVGRTLFLVIIQTGIKIE
jgi:hypothetical protein